ncbi:MAG: XdhC family protein [Planctomycetota bacterium]|jgi:xanthine dehydrogenase accessory factor
MLDIFEEIARMRADGQRGALATVISTRGSTPGRETMRLLVRESGSFTGTVGGGCIEAEVVDAALEVIEDEAPRRVKFRLTEAATGASGLLCGGEIEVFIEPITAPQLVLFGAGHISQDLCEVATRSGFRVTVVDDRSSFANVDRFPSAAAVLTGDSFEACFEELRVPPSAYCVVVTRGHAMDLECTDFALHSPCAYVGLIGSKVKVRSVLARLRDAGRLEDVDLARLHAPIGIDLGGGTHGEIAVSIVAELIARRRGRLEGLRTKRIPADTMQEIARRSDGTSGAPRAQAPPSAARPADTTG